MQCSGGNVPYRTLIFSLIAILLALPSGLVAAQEDEPDPQVLLDEAATTMLALQSFHFAISTPVGATMLAEQVELEGIEGDVLRPYSFQATFSVELGFISLDLSAIGIGQDIWLSDPTSGGDYVKVASEGDENLPPLALLNPDQLVLQAVDLLRDPAIIGTETIDGVDVTVIGGIFDPNDLESLGTPIPDEFLTGIEPLAVSLAIDADKRIVRAEFAGALLPSEQGGGRIVRRVDLSAFDEPVTIEPPGESN
jgi:hypothetical protein